MQTKKKFLSRNAARQSARTRQCRQQKEELDQIAEKKVTDLITSSARKHKFVKLPSGILSKTGRDAEPLKNLDASYNLAGNETLDICWANETIDQVSMDDKVKSIKGVLRSDSSFGDQGCDESTAECTVGTIFSPSFHISNAIRGDFHNAGGEADSVAMCCDKYDLPDAYSPTLFAEENAAMSCLDAEEKVGGNLSSEVSAIYLAMQQSKLECADEPCQDSISAAYVDASEVDDFDDFDPYLFIKNLPELSAVVPTFRPMLLPKQTRSCPSMTLVLDLDENAYPDIEIAKMAETLVHSTLEYCEDADFTFPVNFNFTDHTVYVKCRPYLKDFMERVAGLFEIIIFTASQSIYAEQLLNVLDPKRRVFRHRVYRESCVYVDGNYLKDLSVLGRDLARVIIVDNSPQVATVEMLMIRDRMNAMCCLFWRSFFLEGNNIWI
ncbi:hypothetical protein ACLOJK_001501 [Asimina triloba]